MIPALQDQVLKVLKAIDSGREQIYKLDEGDTRFVTSSGWVLSIRWNDLPTPNWWDYVIGGLRPNGGAFLYEDIYHDYMEDENAYSEASYHDILGWRPLNPDIWLNAPEDNQLRRVAQIVKGVVNDQ